MGLLSHFNSCRVFVIGDLPPPFGGVSVHIKRLAPLLIANNCEVEVFNLASWSGNFLKRIQSLYSATRHYQPEVIHNHSTDVKIFCVLIIYKILNKVKVYQTFHSARFIINYNFIQRALFKKYINRIDLMVSVSVEVENTIKSILSLPECTLIEPAYIHPQLEQKADILITYSVQLQYFIKDRYPLLITYVTPTLYKGYELYGLDMTLELLNFLKADYRGIGLIVTIPRSALQTEYFKEKTLYIKKHDLSKLVYFFYEEKEIWPLFSNESIFLRPTNTDGDSVSIREALEFSCKVIASDIVERPKDCLIFETRNQSHFNNKVVEVLEKH